MRTLPLALSLSLSLRRTTQSQLTPLTTQLHYRTYKKKRTSFPQMAPAPVAHADILARLGKLSLANKDVIEHAPVKNGQEWRDALKEKADADGVLMTKTVRAPCPKQPPLFP